VFKEYEIMYDWVMWYVGWSTLGLLFLGTGLFITAIMMLPIAALVMLFNLLRGSRLFRG